ncbi:hypothetical protein B0T19DRAFT_428141 [Cercophora scortea]|uniref:Uncharacterized protein n=1 Tax=Cercophora scortea TaxID=314031 RepID=A0AAE0M9T9_9PEZI|nr:hypothetical protein B0T19DRAFT_428141 [Cercophora scortea]
MLYQTTLLATPARSKQMAFNHILFEHHDDEDTDIDMDNASVLTPTTTHKADDDDNTWADPTITYDAVPVPGDTFILVHQPDGRALTLLNGKLRLASLTAAARSGGSFHWACVEKKGWLGFRNAASGAYLGHDGRMGRDGRKGIRATAWRHEGWEYFCARRHAGGGGYVLLTTHWDTLLKVAVEGEGEGVRVVAREEGGSVWEFRKV